MNITSQLTQHKETFQNLFDKLNIAIKEGNLKSLCVTGSNDCICKSDI